MSFSEHLEELRKCLLWSFLFFALAVVVCAGFQAVLMKIAVWPYRRAIEGLEQKLPAALQVLSPPEGFFQYWKLVLLAALFVASPAIFYQLWSFVSSGLYRMERRLITLYGPMSSGLFLLGGLIGYFVLIPLTLRFLLPYDPGGATDPGFRLSDYLDLFYVLTLATGVVFELPLLMLFLMRLGLVERATLCRQRRLAVLGAVILGAVLTPSADVVSQVLLALCLVALYELGLVFGRFLVPKEAVPAGEAT